jgi:heat-inducible transcriptional repressor
MLDIHKKNILYTVVHDYILTAMPVGSSQVAQKKSVDYSPATIRNVMAELERQGFLRRSHASSGRIPTDSGYRFYVDELMQVHPLTNKEKLVIQQNVESKTYPIEQIVQKACQTVSAHSDQISFGTFPGVTQQSLKHIQFLNLKENLVLVILVRSSGLVENKILELDRNISQVELNQMHNYLNDLLCGLNLPQIQTRILQELQKDQIRYNLILSQALMMSQQALEPQNDDLHIEGHSRLFRSPEFTEIETMEKLIKTFEQKTLMLKILHESMVKPGVKILIGDEVEAPEINGLTLITSTYNDAEGNRGYLGVLGPTRINYAKIVPLVEFTTKIVTKTLSEKNA